MRVSYGGLDPECCHELRTLAVATIDLSYWCEKCGGGVTLGWPLPKIVPDQTMEAVAAYHMAILSGILGGTWVWLGLTPAPTDEEIRARALALGIEYPVSEEVIRDAIL